MAVEEDTRTPSATEADMQAWVDKPLDKKDMLRDVVVVAAAEEEHMVEHRVDVHAWEGKHS